MLPLTRWKDKRLAEREEFSDVEDSEDEESDVEDFMFPKKARKRKIDSGDRKVKKPRLQILKNLLGSDGRNSLPDHPLAHLRGDHESRKRHK